MKLRHWICLGRAARVAALACVLLASLGCEAYRLRGIVVQGQAPVITVVDADDARLNSIGVPNAVLEFTLDPRSMRPARLAPVVTDETGHFSVPVDAGGAGFLEYDLGVLARATGYSSVSQMMPLPPGNKHLLIVVCPGRDSGPPPRDVLEETLDLGRKLQER